jgi:hypothetical protein
MKKRGHDKKARQKSILRAKHTVWLKAFDMYTFIDSDHSLIIPDKVMIPFKAFQYYMTFSGIYRRIP